jgi:hypothetical protein
MLIGRAGGDTRKNASNDHSFGHAEQRADDLLGEERETRAKLFPVSHSELHSLDIKITDNCVFSVKPSVSQAFCLAAAAQHDNFRVII